MKAASGTTLKKPQTTTAKTMPPQFPYSADAPEANLTAAVRRLSLLNVSRLRRTREARYVAIAALSLGQVHGVVCGPQQIVWVSAILGIEADADAGRDLQSLLIQSEV